MDYPTIKKLVDKYWEGETSLKEEQQLHAYFNGPKVDKRLQSVQPLFAFFKQEQEKKSQQPLRLWEVIRPQKRWGLVAASIAILITAACWLHQQQHSWSSPSNLAVQESMELQKDTYKDPEKAFQEAKAALMRVSKGLNKGVKATKEGLEAPKE